ncbi:M14 family zinc carboxypeptidase [Agarivorans sp. DSG3-1]|uniref:M14 family zinc carboxypeptidase n=1 Tax=Agarivorans sp. DSG3-1 TaxID=3342249 RepID=UPI00398F3327
MKFSSICLLPLLLGLSATASARFHSAVHDNPYWRLSTYQDLRTQLRFMPYFARVPVQTGALIIKDNNQGIVNIDQALPTDLDINYQVCGEQVEPQSIRQAVVCTVDDGGRGNTNPEHIGWSTQGRELLGIRMGNPSGKRVMIITQQHGNEPAGTEAALTVMRWLSAGFGYSSRRILEQLDILVILRANPDGGEPDPQNCNFNPTPGTVIDENCALIRQNLDPQAGGGFAENSEAGFIGIVGRGYDLNRYHHVKLDKPIRPVESQAMVAAALAFQPHTVLDLHGDLQKTDCQLDFRTIQPAQVLGVLPTVDCLSEEHQGNFRLLSPFADAIPDSQQEKLVQSLAVEVMQRVDRLFVGSTGRFSQVQLGAGNISSGATGNYQFIGAAAGGWETVNFTKDLRGDVVALVDGQAVIGVNPGLPEPSLISKQIWINRIALFEALSSLAGYAQHPPQDTNGFCEYPLAQGLRANLPAEYWGSQATNGPQLIPIDPGVGVPLYISGNCPDNPL